MNDTLEIAKKCGAEVFDDEGYANFDIILKPTQLQSFREEIEKLERERCAKVCESHDPRPDQWSDMREYSESRIVNKCAEAIRKGDKP